MSESIMYERYTLTRDAMHRTINTMKPHWGRAIWLALLDASRAGDYRAMRNIVAHCNPGPMLSYFLSLVAEAEKYALALGY